MLAFLSSTTSFVSVPTLAVMPIGGKMISSQSLSTVTKQILLGVTTTNIYTSPLKAMETILNRANIKKKKVEALSNSDIGVSSFDLIITLSFMLKRVANPSELYSQILTLKNNEKEVILTDG
jgi:hypothetical protein